MPRHVPRPMQTLHEINVRSAVQGITGRSVRGGRETCQADSSMRITQHTPVARHPGRGEICMSFAHVRFRRRQEGASDGKAPISAVIQHVGRRRVVRLGRAAVNQLRPVGCPLAAHPAAVTAP